MSRPPNDPSHEDEPLVRPFLAGSGTGGMPAAPDEPRDDAEVRPYVMTGGRSRSRTDLPWEALVVTSHQGRFARGSFETGQILRLCMQMQSVAEVSAHLRIPIGVARVLVADLVADGLLEAATPPPRRPAEDVEFLERLMQGVAAL
ncbi:MAG TPA: DUF742 domain-containing protein [Pseudonocardia sp.]|nr:DUF742 domain-containing protein [Pseudonocardia sp.]